MLEIMQKANISNISIYNIKTLSRTDTVIYEVDFRINNLEKLNNYIRDLSGLKYVESIERTMR
jgi:(p)ppGpp synthase/HD superfamily hydrolase